MCTTRLASWFRWLFEDGPSDPYIPTLAYPRFDPSSLGPEGPRRTALIVGPAVSGKTALIKSLPQESADVHLGSDTAASDLDALSEEGRLIIEDKAWDPAFMRSKELCKLFFTKKRVIMTIQAPLGVGPNIRNNADVVFVAKPSEYQLNQVYKTYFSSLPRSEYDRLMTNLEPYEFLVAERGHQYVGGQRVSLYKPAINTEPK